MLDSGFQCLRDNICQEFTEIALGGKFELYITMYGIDCSW